jgi:hypothetical protein|tara:strand:+ start:641 stop:1204 length:564 start_codon:yes stop_codon:yes gene_type:complete
MANTTFNGPVRSENGFEQITKDSTTGAITTVLDIDSSGNISTTGTINNKQKIDTTFNAAGAASETLTAAQSGTLFLINGAAANVITLPAVSTANVGVTYDFFLTVAVGGSVTTTIVLPGSAVSDFQTMKYLVGGTAANAVSDVAGDTLTLPNSTVANARVSMTCVSDDGTNSKWMTTTLSTPIATVA